MKQPYELAKELIETGELKRLECGTLDVHVDVLEKFATEHHMEKYDLLDAILRYEDEYIARSIYN
tara:strand:- start:166 stop:360 length:195 start_codon:yes stop_codon:yes gene_type:complete